MHCANLQNSLRPKRKTFIDANLSSLSEATFLSHKTESLGDDGKSFFAI